MQASVLACCEDVSQGYAAAGHGGDLRLALGAKGDPGVPDAGRQRLCGIAYGDLHSPELMLHISTATCSMPDTLKAEPED